MTIVVNSNINSDNKNKNRNDYTNDIIMLSIERRSKLKPSNLFQKIMLWNCFCVLKL